MIPFGIGAKLLGGLAVVAALHAVAYSLVQKGKAQCQAEYAEAAIIAQQENARTLVLKHDRNLEIANEQARRAAKDAADRVDLRRQLERMRNSAAASAQAASQPSTTGATDDNGELRRLLAEGAQRVVELGELVEEGRARIAELTSKVTGLQDYATGVCGGGE